MPTRAGWPPRAGIRSRGRHRGAPPRTCSGRAAGRGGSSPGRTAGRRWCVRRGSSVVAMESFEGTLGGLSGTFNFVHSATTRGEGREAEFFVIVPGSGTEALTGIRGAGGLRIDADGTHRIWFEYEVGEGS
ncbi:DUF3224 domain-containing protein [Streptomyces sp. NPDC054783]